MKAAVLKGRDRERRLGTKIGTAYTLAQVEDQLILPPMPPQLDDRHELWKLQYAWNDFRLIVETIDHMEKERIGAKHPLYDSLLTAVYTLYGRAFGKSFGAGILDASIVPPEQNGLHESIIKHRNTIHAHLDSVGAPMGIGNANQVRIVIKGGRATTYVTRFRALPGHLKDIRKLADALRDKVAYRVKRLEEKHLNGCRLHDGHYLINVDAATNDFFVPAPPLPDWSRAL